MEERRTAFSARGLSLSGAGGAVEDLDLFAASMHYWRVPRGDWRRCLEAVRELGFAIVDTYVPWGVHEVAAEQFDWTDDLDLGAFIDTAGELGLKVILRPGPHINAELTLFGFPERVLRDARVLARTARDTPAWLPLPPRMFPVPSYASRIFQREVRHWFDEVAEVVVPRMHPAGPVVALHIDDDMPMFFRGGAYDLDYHADAIAWWHEAGGTGEPPRAWDPADAARCVDWVRFKERYTARALTWLARAVDASGMGGLALGGLAPLAGSGEPLPFAPKVGVGGSPWLPPMTEADQQSVTLGLLAGGMRALSFTMVVDRERWYGAALGTRGERRPPADWLQSLLATLRDVEWTRLRRRAPVALILARADARFATASSRVDPLSPVLAEFLRLGPAGAAELGGDAGAIEQRRWFVAVEQALALGGVPYDIVDEECPVERLRGYRALVLPTIDRVDRGLWARLHEAAAAGARVVLGPGVPSRDELDAPLADPSLPKRAGLIRAESRDDLAGLAADLAAVAGEVDEPVVDGVNISVFRDDGDRPRVLLAGNRGAVPVDLDVPGASGKLGPHQVRLFVLDGLTD